MAVLGYAVVALAWSLNNYGGAAILGRAARNTERSARAYGRTELRYEIARAHSTYTFARALSSATVSDQPTQHVVCAHFEAPSSCRRAAVRVGHCSGAQRCEVHSAYETCTT